MFEKLADTAVPINDLIARRWSGRAFDPHRHLTTAQITSLIESARWAPSCFGDQPWRFVICDNNTDPGAWKAAYECLSEGNRSWAVNAPLLMLSVADSIMSKNNKPNRWGQYDTGAACMNLCIQATAMGLMVHQMGGFDADKAREVFMIPEQYTPMAMISIGYQLPVTGIPEEIKEREFSVRQRNPVAANFFSGTWNKAWTS